MLIARGEGGGVTLRKHKIKKSGSIPLQWNVTASIEELVTNEFPAEIGTLGVNCIQLPLGLQTP